MPDIATDYPYDLGRYTCPVTTTSDAAQIWFDRGLNWTFGFNHNEAIACYTCALEADPGCAMAYWGIAYAAGPNYNMPWALYDDRGRAKALAQAYDATQNALERIEGLTAVERALIEALPARYPQRDITDSMSAWDQAYADAMRKVLANHPEHLDVRSVFVESLMNLSPWKMWDLRKGVPADGAYTVEAQDVLETALDAGGAAMAHPGLLHLYVHLMEMSPHPEKALKAGDILRTLVPDAGHLVHMPTHIDVLCGDYVNVVRGNEAAVEADLKYFEKEGAFNVYTGYRQHNYHFVVYGALFLGQIEPALSAVRGMAETVPEAMLRIESPPMADFFESYMGLEPHILVRFGKWEELTQMQPPEDPELYCTLNANTLYARAVAFAALGRVAEAEAEEKLFLAACDSVPKTRMMHNNTVRDLLEIAKEMVRGEIEYRKGNYDAAYAHLRRSVALDDDLPYDEPWGWMQPARHALGALLFEQGHAEEAEAVYREDLGLGGQLSRATVHPDNIWSLRGLHDCLKKRGETIEIKQIRQRLDMALARADEEMAASCFCAQAAMKIA
ncbi:MAG: tetratricopeptide repeat protein [Marinibacterium sp.]|nr:tetratricopeptide repeat protein [Marinibacterium sp.]